MIRFHYSYPSFRIRKATDLKTWINKVVSSEKKKIKQLDFIFVDDRKLKEINKKSLGHDYYTDILTFAYSYHPIEGELYISIDRLKAHAKLYRVRFESELHRVMVHGVLHLCEYGDHTKIKKEIMTGLEDKYLKRL